MVSAENINCTGCGVCALICTQKCIMITENKRGEYFPIKNNRCIECNLCNQYCIGMGNIKKGNVSLESYYGYSKNESNRLASSSGGVFYEIAKHFIENKGIVVGAAFNNKGLIQHIIVEQIKQIELLRGSKYTESTIYVVFKDIKKALELGKNVLFSGVPCNIAALKTYLRKEYNNLYTCEIFCHGMPRIGVFKKYKDYIEKRHREIISFNFRSKAFGWSNPAYEIHTRSKVILQRHPNNIYHLMFGYHHSLRENCLHCQFRCIERQADISLGDFWGVDQYYPNICDREKGVSAILINTEKGKELIDNDILLLKECKKEEIFNRNKWQVQNFPTPSEYEDFNLKFQLMNTDRFFLYYNYKYKFSNKIKRLFKKYVSQK